MTKDEDIPPKKYWVGYDVAPVQVTRELPTHWEGKRYAPWELEKLGEGDRDTRLDADYYDQQEGGG